MHAGRSAHLLPSAIRCGIVSRPLASQWGRSRYGPVTWSMVSLGCRRLGGGVMRRNAFVLASAIVLVAACTSTTPGSSGAASGAASAAAGASAAGGGTIKIGGGFALTGDESALDLPAANGAKLAVQQINTAGGVDGVPNDLIRYD